MKIHELKCWPEPYEALIRGIKTYEVRKNDRGFQVGDLLRLEEWDPEIDDDAGGFCLGLTGRVAEFTVSYMTSGGAFGLPEDLCVMSVVLLEVVES